MDRNPSDCPSIHLQYNPFDTLPSSVPRRVKVSIFLVWIKEGEITCTLYGRKENGRSVIHFAFRGGTLLFFKELHSSQFFTEATKLTTSSGKTRRMLYLGYKLAHIEVFTYRDFQCILVGMVTAFVYSANPYKHNTAKVSEKC